MEKQCEKIRENIQGYFEESLSKITYENTEKHLKECSDCSWYFREYEKMNEILSRWEVPPVSDSFEKTVISFIADQASEKNNSFFFRYFSPAFLGFAALVLAAGISLFYYFSLPVVIGQGKEIGDRLLVEEGPVFTLKTKEEIHARSSDLELLFNDGSLLKLSKGARLVVNTFSRSEKSCTLLGEMKAEIKKYPDQEFTVKTDNGEIRVLGTTFIISAMKSKTIVGVLEGSVAVKGKTEKTQLTKGNLTVVSKASRFVTPISALDAVKEKDKYLKVQALRLLTEIKGKEEIQGVINLLSDPDETIRAEAATSLGLLGAGNKEIQKPLLKALRDKDKFVRMCAAVALGKLKIVEAREPLKWLEGDPETEAKIGGALGLVYLGEKPFEVKALAKELDSNYSDTRAKTVKLLGKMGTEKITMKIAEKLKDKDPSVRWYAVRALERLNDPRTFPAILEAVKDPDLAVKRKAIQAVSNLFYADGAAELALTLKETSSREIKLTAIRSLGYLLMNYYKNDKAELLEVLEKCINDRDRLVKVAGLTAYARAAGTDSLQKVYEVSVKDGNKIMKETAVSILKIIRKPDFRFNLRPVEIRALGKLKEKSVVPVLLTAAKDWNPQTREAAMEGFENLRDTLYLTVLYEGMKDSNLQVAEAAEEAVKSLIN